MTKQIVAHFDVLLGDDCDGYYGCGCLVRKNLDDE
jgi:hypothetical protein